MISFYLKNNLIYFFFGKTLFKEDNILFAYPSDTKEWANLLLDKNKKYLSDKENIINNFLNSELPTLGDRREMKIEEWYDYFDEIWDKAILYNLNNDKSI